MRRALLALVASVGAVACAERANDAVPVASPLGAAIDEFPEPFTGPIRMVELRDGRVLLMDTRERRLLRVDFSSGRFDTTSRNGEGPLEYRSTVFKLALAPGDSVWTYDLSRKRIIVFSPDGEPVRSFSSTGAEDRMDVMSSPWMIAVDSSGRWIGQGQRFSDRPPYIASGHYITRNDPRTAAQDSIVTLANPTLQRTEQGSYIVGSFEARDGWAAFSDGTVLVVRGANYFVELHRLGAGVDSIGAVAHRRVPLTQADAEYVRDSTAKLQGALVAATLANIPELRNRPLPPTHVLPDPLPTHWPVLVSDDPIVVDRQDRAWVRVRTAAFDTGAARYDLLGRDGRFIKAVELPVGEQLVGFGREVVYLARRDEDDLLHLRRYPLPE